MESPSPGRRGGWDPLPPPPTPAAPAPTAAVNVTLGGVGKPQPRRPGPRLLCSRCTSTAEPLCSGAPRTRPLVLLLQLPLQPASQGQQSAPAAGATPLISPRRCSLRCIHPGGGRSRDPGAINIPVQPEPAPRPPTPSTPPRSPALPAIAAQRPGLSAWGGAGFICNRGLASPSSPGPPPLSPPLPPGPYVKLFHLPDSPAGRSLPFLVPIFRRLLPGTPGY